MMADRRDGLRVKLNGRGYTVDTEEIVWTTPDVGRSSVDQGAGAGEQSLSNDLIWRRSRDDGIEGAGQDFADMLNNESSDLRFRTSLNIDPWTRRQFTLLHATTHALTSSNTNLLMAVATQSSTPYVFVIDGSALKRTADPTGTPTWTTLTGGAGTYTSITTDGARIWVANGTDVYKVDSGTALAAFSTVDTDIIGYANGRLLGAKGNVLFELDGAGASTTIFTHPSSAFVWDGIITSPAGIYCFGHLGTKTEIYVTTAVDSTGALDVPFYAGGLPYGELLNTMCFYLGVMVLGTTVGVRLAQITGGGFLSVAPAIEEPGSVTCLEPQGPDVWFGWSGFAGPVSGTYSGLGRTRLSRFTSDLVGAFATDLMVQQNATTKSAVTFAGKRLFSLSGLGVYCEDTAHYATPGTIDFGWMSWGIPEPKLIDSGAVWSDALPASTSIGLKVYPDDSATATVDGTESGTGTKTATFAASSAVTAERLRMVLTLTGTTSATPTLRRATVRVVPAPFVAQQIVLPVVIADDADDQTGVSYGMDVYADWLFLWTLMKARTRIPIEIGNYAGSYRIDGLEAARNYFGYGIDGWSDRGEFLKGKWNVTLTELEPSG